MKTNSYIFIIIIIETLYQNTMIYVEKNPSREKYHTLKFTQYIIQNLATDKDTFIEKYSHRNITNI